MGFLSVPALNRLGFGLLGLTNNSLCSILLSAAFDLLSRLNKPQQDGAHLADLASGRSHLNSTLITHADATSEPYCNEQSTSVVLLAMALPSLAIKIIYPYVFISVPASYKAIASAILAAAAFLVTGLSYSRLFIFAGLICSSISYGLAEPNFVSITQHYGETSLSGWSMGTGFAGITGSLTYAVLRMAMSVEAIMVIMLIIPITMTLAYFMLITPVDATFDADLPSKHAEVEKDTDLSTSEGTQNINSANSVNLRSFNFSTKIRQLPSLAKYFLPLLLVYFAEYFINQGLFELIYYPEVQFLDHAAQYRWFQVSYQLGVMISRSSVEFVRLKNTWTMSLLQCANAILFSAHAAKLIRLPNFYLLISLVVYEGLLGGFMYVSTFYRIRDEVSSSWQKFSISTVLVAETLGSTMGALLALPVHNALCKLYV